MSKLEPPRRPLSPSDLIIDHPDAVVLVRKTHATEAGGPEYTLSDQSIDRHGDQILASGWDLREFKRNSICLVNHRSDFPVGRWADVRIEGTALVGRLVLAPAGTSDRVDEIRKLVEAQVLTATSVGFRPISSRPRSKDGGLIFERQILIEASLVSIPSNPNAVQIARSLGISDETRSLIFAKPNVRKVATTTKPQRPGAVVEGKRAELEQEYEQLVRRLCTAVDHLANARALYAALKEMPASAARSQELAVVLQQMRGHEITASALSTLLGVNGRELQRLDRQIAITRTARAHIARRK